MTNGEWKTTEGGVCAPQGFLAGGLHCGIRKSQSKKDLAMIYSAAPCAAAAMYTQNKVYGAPITVTRANLADGTARAVVCNSGNANTCNADGVEKAARMCALTAAALGIASGDVIVASTGVIGEVLDIAPIQSGIAALAPALSRTGNADAADAIMTTDTRRKEAAVALALGGHTVHIGAMAKGSGMIHPNMATMLVFLTTDAAIAPAMLSAALRETVEDTFNMISIDGDTSTNDMVSIMANGLAGNPFIAEQNADYAAFASALRALLTDMSRRIAADGEGATKLLTCTVTGAPDKATAKKVAKSVICSSLFKAAMFGADANWGRILCAIGYTDAEFDVHKVDVALGSAAGEIPVCRDGAGVPFCEETAKTILLQKEIAINIAMKQGAGEAVAWGCDLTYDYVKINGDYRS